MTRPLLALLLLLTLSHTAYASSSLRCGSQLISLGDDQASVRRKCGEPVHQEFLGYRERQDQWGFYHELELQEWVYGPRNGMYQFLQFEGNRLSKIQSKRR